MNEREIEDIIELWHEGYYPNMELHEALGWTWSEYKDWLSNKRLGLD
jgi:hypothetical protein